LLEGVTLAVLVGVDGARAADLAVGAAAMLAPAGERVAARA
jgi:hypothetical protein